jgi:hypothetical protein
LLSRIQQLPFDLQIFLSGFQSGFNIVQPECSLISTDHLGVQSLGFAIQLIPCYSKRGFNIIKLEGQCSIDILGLLKDLFGNLPGSPLLSKSLVSLRSGRFFR